MVQGDEQYYNITQACRILGCYRQEFHRLCEILRITPQSFEDVRKISQYFEQGKHAPWNRKEKYITGEELAQLRELRGAVPDAMDQLAVIGELRKRVAELEAIVRRLSPQPTQMHLVEGGASSESPRRLVQGPSHRPVLPDGWVSLDGFCRKHAIARSTVDKAIATGRLPKPHRGEWQEGRAVILSALDEEMQAAVLERYGHML